MAIYENGDHRTHEMHGAQFHSYVAPFRGSRELCAWRTVLPPGATGVPHAVSHEEVLLVLEGAPTLTIDAQRTELAPGDVAYVPARATVRLENPGDRPASLWVTTSVGLTAAVRTAGADDQVITPPWTL